MAMTHRYDPLRKVPLRKTPWLTRSLFILSLSLVLSAAGCTSLTGISGGTGDGRDGSSTQDTEAGADDSGESEPAAADGEAVSGDVTEEDGRFIRVTEEYWIQTPWFGVSSLILTVKRLPGPSAIIVSPDSILAGTMSVLPEVVHELPADHPSQPSQSECEFSSGRRSALYRSPAVRRGWKLIRPAVTDPASIGR